MNSVTSCWMNLKSGFPPKWAILSTEPVTKLSMPMTLCPRASNKSVKCDPRKPAAPVTTEVGCAGALCFLGRIFSEVKYQQANSKLQISSFREIPNSNINLRNGMQTLDFEV